jgi:tetratricopeptide (TPR) repeat protein
MNGYTILIQHARENKLLVFAGAGVSMAPPSSLPSWNAFNDAVLHALTAAVGDYMSQPYSNWTLARLTSRRDTTPFFAPDFMADIIAEEVGRDYFRVLQALDTDAINDGHRALAALVASGAVRAIVTTNFDRLIERALEELQVEHDVFATTDDFERLDNIVQSGLDKRCLLIKVHGTVENPESMVDTLSQRLRGRPEALNAALRTLIAHLHVLFLGFSGADLDYDHHYLGLRAAAEANRGFTYLTRAGQNPRRAIVELAEAWGDNSTIVFGSLPGWLLDITKELGVIVEPSETSTDMAIKRLEAVQTYARRWADSLGRLSTVNIATSLLRASGDDATAARMYFTTWRHYRRPEDVRGPAYARFNHQVGQFLLEYGYDFASIRPPTSIGFVSGNAPFDRDKLDNAFNFSARAVDMGFAAALPTYAACFAFKGEVNRGVDVIKKCLESAEELGPMIFIDSVIAGGFVWYLAGTWSNGLAQLRAARDLTESLGLEVRRAQLCAHLVRFLTWRGEFDEAAKRYEEGRRITERLGIEPLGLEIESAWAYTLMETRHPAEALAILRKAGAVFQETGRLISLTRTSLDQYRAAWEAGNQDAYDEALQRLSEYPAGFRVQVHNVDAEIALLANEVDVLREHIVELRRAAKETDNPFGQILADAYTEKLNQLH